MAYDVGVLRTIIQIRADKISSIFLSEEKRVDHSPFLLFHQWIAHSNIRTVVRNSICFYFIFFASNKTAIRAYNPIDSILISSYRFFIREKPLPIFDLPRRDSLFVKNKRTTTTTKKVDSLFFNFISFWLLIFEMWVRTRSRLEGFGIPLGILCRLFGRKELLLRRMAWRN